MFFKKIVSLERPVVVKGKELKIKIQQKNQDISDKITIINETIKKDYENVIEGTIKSQQKREMLKTINDFELQKVWLRRLSNALDDKIEYSLTLTEAINLDIIKDSEINQTPN